MRTIVELDGREVQSYMNLHYGNIEMQNLTWKSSHGIGGDVISTSIGNSIIPVSLSCPVFYLFTLP